MANQTAQASTPSIVNLTVKRRYLTEREVERLIEAAKSNRHGHRDATMVLVAYRHGFRASEVCDLHARPGPLACPQSQAWHTERPSDPR